MSMCETFITTTISDSFPPMIVIAWHFARSNHTRKGGVVDSYLNVYGINGLKVANLSIGLSIGPGNVSVNTYSIALVIGEKAAMIIAEELGIRVKGVL